MNVITRSRVRMFLLMKTDVGQYTYPPVTDFFGIFGILSAPKTLHCHEDANKTAVNNFRSG